MSGFRKTVACSRLLAHTLVVDGIPMSNMVLSRDGDNLFFSPFSHETESTPFFNRVEVSGNPPSVIARDGNQSIIIEI